MKRYIVLKPDGEYTTGAVEQFTLGWMQAQVGGDIAGLQVKNDVMFWLDEAGLLKDLPVNGVASIVAAAMQRIPIEQPLVGTVVVTGLPTKKNGELRGLSAKTEQETKCFFDKVLELKRKAEAQIEQQRKETEQLLSQGYL